MLDYNIDWNIHFYLEAQSPSGLSWNRDVIGGNGRGYIRTHKHSPVGYVSHSSLGKPLAWAIELNGRCYLIHRIIWSMKYGNFPPDLCIDHLDGNPLNNCIDNLRLVTKRVNCQNRSLPKNNKTGVMGVGVLFSSDGVKYYRSTCRSSSNKSKSQSKFFSVDKLGEEGAFKAACASRLDMIMKLNTDGENYTDRHG